MFLSHWINNPVSRIRAAPVLRPPLANHFCSRIRIVYLYSFLSLTHFTSSFMLSTNIKHEISILPHVGPHPILQPTGYFSSIFTHNCAPLQTVLDPTNLDLICPHSWRVLCCRLSFISQTWIWFVHIVGEFSAWFVVRPTIFPTGLGMIPFSVLIPWFGKPFWLQD